MLHCYHTYRRWFKSGTKIQLLLRLCLMKRLLHRMNNLPPNAMIVIMTALIIVTVIGVVVAGIVYSEPR